MLQISYSYEGFANPTDSFPEVLMGFPLPHVHAGLIARLVPLLGLHISVLVVTSRKDFPIRCADLSGEFG